MSLPLICNICKKGSDIDFNYDIEELLEVNKDYSCYKCNKENFKNLISKYNITQQNLFTKKEFKNSIWGEHLPITIIVLIVLIIILISSVKFFVKEWDSLPLIALFISLLFFFFPIGSIAFALLFTIYKKFLKRIDLNNEYEKYCIEKNKSNEGYLEYKLLIEIRKSFIDEKSLDINKIKSAIKFIKWSNESDDYFMVYGMILQLDNKFNEAINIFKKVYGKTDRNGAIRLIADSYFNLKEYENALSYYKKYFTFDLRDKSIVDSMISSCHTLIKAQKS